MCGTPPSLLGPGLSHVMSLQGHHVMWPPPQLLSRRGIVRKGADQRRTPALRPDEVDILILVLRAKTWLLTATVYHQQLYRDNSGDMTRARHVLDTCTGLLLYCIIFNWFIGINITFNCWVFLLLLTVLRYFRYS